MNIIISVLCILVYTIIISVISFKVGVYAAGEAIKEMEKEGKITLKK